MSNERPNETHTTSPAGTETSRLLARRRTLAVAVAVTLVVAVAAIVLVRRGASDAKSSDAATEAHSETEDASVPTAVDLTPPQLEAAKIAVEGVTERVAVTPLAVTGTVEANQEETQQVTPLVGGRVERVFASLGDVVRAGAPLAVIASPEVAELHGKLLEAETRRALAARDLARVQKAENRAAVLSAKARLDEADATLRRTRKLVDLGAGAGKDLIAAETAFTTAKAEYDYQSSIALSREVQAAEAELDTATTEVRHLRQSLEALGGTADGVESKAGTEISLVTLRAPISGTITERAVNAGAGIQAGSPVFTIGNLSTVWVIANVPEAQIGLLRIGGPAVIRSAAIDGDALAGRVSYIDPRLDEQTRTGRVRVAVSNPNGKLRAGSFVRVGFEGAASNAAGPLGREVVVSSKAVQRLGERTIVFVPAEEAGRFAVRDVELGGETAGYRRVVSGLEVGERVVTDGSFTLKTQLMKSELGEE